MEKIINENNFPSENQRVERNEVVKYIATPYICGTTERVDRILRPFGIKLGSKAPRTLKNHFKSRKD